MQAAERTGIYAARGVATAAGLLASVTGSLFGKSARESSWARQLMVLHSLALMPPTVAALVRNTCPVPSRGLGRHNVA